MTLIDVLDSAVKIGLGASISGLFTMWGGNAARRHELDKERLRRRQDSIEKIAGDFSPIFAKLLSFAESFRIYILAGPVKSTELSAVLRSLRTTSAKTYEEFQAFYGRLKALGLNKPAARVNEFYKVTADLYTLAEDIYSQRSPFHEAELEKLIRDLPHAADAIFEELASAHSKL